jgi:hypothetical protein
VKKNKPGVAPRVPWEVRKEYLGNSPSAVQGWMHWWDAYITTKLSQIQHRLGLFGSIGIPFFFLLFPHPFSSTSLYSNFSVVGLGSV